MVRSGAAGGDPSVAGGAGTGGRVLGTPCRTFVWLLALASLIPFAARPAGAEEEREDAPVVEAGRKVTIEFTVQLDDGTTVETNVGGTPVVYEQGGNMMLPALQAEIAGLKVNDTKKVKLTPEQAYGKIKPDAFESMPLDRIPESERVAGMVLLVRDPLGQPRVVRIHEVREDSIVLNLNHPLAGQNLSFDVKILAIE